MNNIKSLILKEWFRFFTYSIIVLIAIVSISDIVSGLMRGSVSSTEVLYNYLLELPQHINKILPISCLVASLFSINKLKNTNELTAIFSLGFSRKKVLLYLAEASLLIAMVQFINNSFVQPSVMKKKGSLISKYGKKFKNLKSKGLRSSTIGSGKIWFKSPEYYFSFSSYNKFENVLNSLTIFYLDENQKISKIVKSNKATHIQDNKWQLLSGTTTSMLSNNEFPKEEKFDSLNIALNEVPQDFKNIESDITTLTIFKLYEYISGLNSAGISTGEYQVLFLEKFSSSLICVIFALLAAIGIFNPNRRNSSFGKNLIIVFIFTLSYWLINSFFFEQGKSARLDPYLASFGVPIVFGFFLAYYLYKNRKLT